MKEIATCRNGSRDLHVWNFSQETYMEYTPEVAPNVYHGILASPTPKSRSSDFHMIETRFVFCVVGVQKFPFIYGYLHDMIRYNCP